MFSDKAVYSLSFLGPIKQNNKSKWLVDPTPRLAIVLLIPTFYGWSTGPPPPSRTPQNEIPEVPYDQGR